MNKLPDCSICGKSVTGNPYFITEKGVVCYSCKGKARKNKKKGRKPPLDSRNR